MADFILNMPLRLFARVFGNPAGDPVLLKSRGVTLLRDKNTLLAYTVIFLCCLSLTHNYHMCLNPLTPKIS